MFASEQNAKGMIILATLLLSASTTQALRCVTCEGARSHAECDRIGILRECLSNEEICAIEERKVGFGPSRKIFKSCKQPWACSNNLMQNEGAAWWPTQCNSRYPNSVCRCCCDTDSCNAGSHNCAPPNNPVLCFSIFAPSNGQVNCSNSNAVGSSCSFSCDKGFALKGKVNTLCNSGGVWGSPSPVCVAIRCNPPFTKLTNGFIDCDNKNHPESECKFKCDAGYELFGSATSICAYNENSSAVRWSNRAPTCKPIKCLDQGAIKNGEVVCDKGNIYDSQCSFVCKSNEYEHHPPDITSNQCLVNGSWSKPKPCCFKPCPPHAVFDLVMALDSSSSVGVQGWKQTLEFVKSFAQLYDLNVLNFALFRYNSRVDSSSEIHFDSGFEPPQLMREIGQIPYDGTGTNTGKALTYAKDVILNFNRGRRRGAKPVVIVVTDGKSQDNVGPPAEKLRKAGIETFAVGVTPLDGQLDFDQLRVIAGDWSRVTIAEDGYVDLDEDFAKELSKEVCGDPCKQAELADEE